MGDLPRQQERIATVDTAISAPPPSPLAPVDLTDPAQVTGVLDIAARIGEILIAAGTSNSDARAQVYLAAASYGVHYCHVDIIMNTITIHTSIGAGHSRQSITVFRVAPSWTVNFSKLSAVDRLIRSIHAGTTPPALAEKILDDIASMKPPRPLYLELLGWGVMGGGFAVMLGGGALVCAIACSVAMLIMGVSAWMNKLRLPPFYHNIVGGFLAVVPAAVLYHAAAPWGVTFSPSQVIGMGIIVLVAGLTLVQSLVDGITRAPVTSTARFFEALLSTAAIVGGVGMGIQFSAAIGYPLPPLGALAPPVYHQIPLLVLAGAIGSAGFAYASFASWAEVIVSGLTAGVGMLFYYVVTVPFGAGTVIASGASAIVIGLAGGLLARRYFIPPLITMIIGYTPLLPGLTLYRGMYAALNEQMLVGVTSLITALAVAGALAAGVLLGERGARRLRRPRYFRPYTAFRRLGRYSVSQARGLAARAGRTPRSSFYTTPAGKPTETFSAMPPFNATQENDCKDSKRGQQQES
ncbi:MAG: threonine/serine exporter family protein [Corynebacterium sp.]|nr:threonine/serine exporter family protein [Corynebacterium sp.]